MTWNLRLCALLQATCLLAQSAFSSPWNVISAEQHFKSTLFCQATLSPSSFTSRLTDPTHCPRIVHLIRPVVGVSLGVGALAAYVHHPFWSQILSLMVTGFFVPELREPGDRKFVFYEEKIYEVEAETVAKVGNKDVPVVVLKAVDSGVKLTVYVLRDGQIRAARREEVPLHLAKNQSVENGEIEPQPVPRGPKPENVKPRRKKFVQPKQLPKETANTPAAPTSEKALQKALVKSGHRVEIPRDTLHMSSAEVQKSREKWTHTRHIKNYPTPESFIKALAKRKAQGLSNHLFALSAKIGGDRALFEACKRFFSYHPFPFDPETNPSFSLMADSPVLEVVGVKLGVLSGPKPELGTLRVDLIVHPTNTDVQPNGEVLSPAKYHYWGPVLELASQSAPLLPGAVIVTYAGWRVEAAGVLHAAITDVQHKLDRDAMQQALAGCIELAARMGARTIAFPPFGLGSYGLSAEESATIMVATLAHSLSTTSSNLADVILYARDPHVARAFSDALLHYSAQNRDRAQMLPSRSPARTAA